MSQHTTRLILAAILPMNHHNSQQLLYFLHYLQDPGWKWDEYFCQRVLKTVQFSLMPSKNKGVHGSEWLIEAALA